MEVEDIVRLQDLTNKPASSFTSKTRIATDTDGDAEATSTPIRDIVPFRQELLEIGNWSLRGGYYHHVAVIPLGSIPLGVYILDDDGVSHGSSIYDLATHANLVNKIESRDMTLSSDDKKMHFYMYGQRPLINVSAHCQAIQGNALQQNLMLMHNCPSLLNNKYIDVTFTIDHPDLNSGGAATVIQHWHALQQYDPSTLRIVTTPFGDEIQGNEAFYTLINSFKIGDELIDPQNEANPIFFAQNTIIENISYEKLSDWTPRYDINGNSLGYTNFCSEIIIKLNKPRLQAPQGATFRTFKIRRKANEATPAVTTSYHEQIRQITDVSGGYPTSPNGEKGTGSGYFVPFSDSQLTKFKSTNINRGYVLIGHPIPIV